jgi:hypothetical protein
MRVTQWVGGGCERPSSHHAWGWLAGYSHRWCGHRATPTLYFGGSTILSISIFFFFFKENDGYL